MYNNKTLCAVIPCHNEETQIERVVATMPEYVDQIIIVDDFSQDRTVDKVKQLRMTDKRIVLIEHDSNQGVGGAIASGYKWAKKNDMDLAVVMAGDGQMDPDDLPALMAPVLAGKADYAKGNRLFTGEAFQKIPKIRFFGNGFLSLFTKIASGYWNIADSQSGYTVINKKALHIIDWDLMYKKYGQPNDLLVRLNVENLRVADVHVQPVYNVGETSGIRIHKVIFTIGWLLVKLFFWRLKEKYIIRDFHPLVFFYTLGLSLGGVSFLLFLRVFYVWFATGHIPTINAFAAFSSFIASAQFSLFAMWFDMEANKHLKADDE